MAIPLKPLSYYKIEPAIYPLKLLSQKVIFCKYLKFDPLSTFPVFLKLRLLRYLKNFKYLSEVKIRDFISKPWGLYRQFFQRQIHNIREIRCDLQALGRVAMKGQFIPLKKISYLAMAEVYWNEPKYQRNLRYILTPTGIDLEKFVDFLRHQRHIKDHLKTLHLRRNNPTQLSRVINSDNFWETFPSLNRWTLFLNFPNNNNELNLFSITSAHYWRHLQWVYISFGTHAQLAYFSRNCHKLEDMYSLEIVYYGMEIMENFDYESLQNYQNLKRIRTFSYQMSCLGLKDISKFWNNFRLPHNVQDLGFHISKLRYTSSENFDQTEIHKNITKIFGSLTKMRKLDIKFTYVDRSSKQISELYAKILMEMLQLEEANLSMGVLTNEHDSSSKVFYTSEIYPLFSKMNNVTSFTIQAPIVDRMYIPDALSQQKNPRFKSFNLHTDGCLQHTGGELDSLFDSIILKKIFRLRILFPVELTDLQISSLFDCIKKMELIDYFAICIKGICKEETLAKFTDAFLALRNIRTLKFIAKDIEVPEALNSVIRNTLYYHRSLNNVNVSFSNFKYIGNEYLYRISQ